jgi:uncharacterized membrane protein YjjP (DUF1212 family)
MNPCIKEKEIEKIQRTLDRAADLKVIEEGRLVKIEETLKNIEDKIDNFISVSNKRLDQKANQNELDEIKKEVRAKPITVGVFASILTAMFIYLITFYFNNR